MMERVFALVGRTVEVRRVVGVAARTVAAVAGGYALAALVALAFATALPLSPLDAVLTGMMTSFAIYAAAAVWVFAAPSAARAWLGLAAAAVPLAAVAMLGHWHAAGKLLP